MNRMGCNTRGTQLREDKAVVGYNRGEACFMDTVHQFISAERPLPCSTPYIDSFCIKHEDIGVPATK